jgi:hypothetical protein
MLWLISTLVSQSDNSWGIILSCVGKRRQKRHHDVGTGLDCIDFLVNDSAIGECAFDCPNKNLYCFRTWCIKEIHHSNITFRNFKPEALRQHFFQTLNASPVQNGNRESTFAPAEMQKAKVAQFHRVLDQLTEFTHSLEKKASALQIRISFINPFCLLAQGSQGRTQEAVAQEFILEKVFRKLFNFPS